MRMLLPLALLLCSTVQAQEQERVTLVGYTPPVDREPLEGPNHTLCEEPWEEMVGDDGIHSTAWHCRPANHTCFALRGDTTGYGCSGGWLPGWVYAEDHEGPIAVDPTRLVVGRTYSVNGEGVPLAPLPPGYANRTPEEVIDAISQFVYMPAGTAIHVLVVDMEDRYSPWYQVALPQYDDAVGWINSVALMPDGVTAGQ